MKKIYFLKIKRYWHKMRWHLHFRTWYLFEHSLSKYDFMWQNRNDGIYPAILSLIKLDHILQHQQCLNYLSRCTWGCPASIKHGHHMWDRFRDVSGTDLWLIFYCFWNKKTNGPNMFQFVFKSAWIVLFAASLVGSDVKVKTRTPYITYGRPHNETQVPWIPFELAWASPGQAPPTLDLHLFDFELQ